LCSHTQCENESGMRNEESRATCTRDLSPRHTCLHLRKVVIHLVVHNIRILIISKRAGVGRACYILPRASSHASQLAWQPHLFSGGARLVRQAASVCNRHSPQAAPASRDQSINPQELKEGARAAYCHLAAVADISSQFLQRRPNLLDTPRPLFGVLLEQSLLIAIPNLDFISFFLAPFVSFSSGTSNFRVHL